MKFYLYLFSAILLSSCSTTQAQRVKGNKDVTIERTDVEAFTHLLVDEDFEIELIQSNSTHVDVETDSNLHEHIHISSRNGTLELSKTANIRRSKRMKITVYASQMLDKITINDDGELRSAGTIKTKSLDITIADSGVANLTVETEVLTVHANKSSKMELDGGGEEANIHLSQNAFMEGNLKFNTANITMDHRSDAEISGAVDNGSVEVKLNSHFRAKSLVWDNMTVTASDDARAEISVKDDLIINAMDDAEISIYNSPNIQIEQFTGEAVLRKEN